jgi:two-component system LytT family response regulator
VLEAFAFGLSLVGATAVTFCCQLVVFGVRNFRWSNWILSGVQLSLILFLWCSLYFSVKQWNRINEIHALDYLVKPINDQRFVAMMEYVKRRLHTASHVPDQRIKSLLDQHLSFSDSSFAIRTGLQTKIVSQEDVFWISAARDYVQLHARTGTVHLLRETMGALEERLDPGRFIRIHRSRIVRRDQIAEILSEDDGEYVIKLRDGSEHRCSRTYSRMLTTWLKPGKE